MARTETSSTSSSKGSSTRKKSTAPQKATKKQDVLRDVGDHALVAWFKSPVGKFLTFVLIAILGTLVILMVTKDNFEQFYLLLGVVLLIVWAATILYSLIRRQRHED